jgi:hypothetical protein
VKRLQIYSGYMQQRLCMAVADGQSRRFYSCVGIFNWYCLSSPPQVLRPSRFPLEWRWLMLYVISVT